MVMENQPLDQSDTAQLPESKPPTRKKSTPLTIDVVWGKLRIQKTVRNGKLKKSYLNLLQTFRDRGRQDFWKAIIKGDTTLETLWEQQKKGELDGVVVVSSVIPLKPSMDKWLVANGDLKPKTKEGYKDHMDLLFKGVSATASIDDLEEIVKNKKLKYSAAKKATTFNRMRAIAMSYYETLYGKYSPQWSKIAAIQVLKVDPKASIKHKGEPRRVVDMMRVCKAMREPYGRYMWTMAVTGMSTSEYFDYGHTVYPDGVHIHGEKNTHRDRRIPIVDADIVAPERSAQITRDWLKKIEPRWQLGDGRKCFQHWCEEAGVEWTRSEIYAGHKPRNQQQFYTWHDTDDFRDGDALLLRNFIAAEIAKGYEPKPIPKPAPSIFSKS